MKLAALGHVKVKSLDTAWARVEALNMERSGRRKPMPRGVLSSIVLRDGESPSQGEGLDGST